MNSGSEQWVVKDKKRLLVAIMQALAGNAHMSFEGDLHGFRLMQLAGASDQETRVLKRSTRWPIQDFVVVPLDGTSIEAVFSAIGGNVPRRILHIQIEKGGNLEFSAYDQFQAGCIVFGGGVSRDLLDALVSQGVLSPFSSNVKN